MKSRLAVGRLTSKIVTVVPNRNAIPVDKVVTASGQGIRNSIILLTNAGVLPYRWLHFSCVENVACFLGSQLLVDLWHLRMS